MPKAAAEIPASVEREVFLRPPTVPNFQKKRNLLIYFLVLTKACGGGIIAKLSDERDK